MIYETFVDCAHSYEDLNSIMWGSVQIFSEQ